MAHNHENERPTPHIPAVAASGYICMSLEAADFIHVIVGTSTSLYEGNYLPVGSSPLTPLWEGPPACQVFCYASRSWLAY
uniref:Uncharacterized protein n=1 Tax=Panagrellus redivivus TaxID=6233 RepID=A0A7E4UNC7_PANRE